MYKSFTQAYQYLCRATDYERMTKFHYTQTVFNLKRMQVLMKRLGNPERHIKFIHIAGTKGKGSTALILSQLLSSAGYKTGLFTSPHLVSLLERIQINNQPISKQAFTRMINILLPHLKRIKPTFFEMMTALALSYFFRQSIDFVIMEVGLGGRLDATNIIRPLISIITRIGFDHMDKLGSSLSAIAWEKAGIIKAGVPVISEGRPEEAVKVIRERSLSKNTPYYLLGKDIKIINQGITRIGKRIGLKCHIETPFATHGDLVIPFVGEHQLKNTALALTAIDYLVSRNWLTSSVRTKSELRQVFLPARLELVSTRPYLIIDTAHNQSSMKATAKSLKYFKYKRLILVLGMARDKNVAAILRLIIPKSDIIIFTRADNPRFCEPMELLKRISDYDGRCPLFLEPDAKKAFHLARILAKQNDLILITGSFYLAGAIYPLVRG